MTSDNRSFDDVIEELIDLGVLGKPIQEDDHHRWPVLKPELLPKGFRSDYEEYGEIRSD